MLNIRQTICYSCLVVLGGRHGDKLLQMMLQPLFLGFVHTPSILRGHTKNHLQNLTISDTIFNCMSAKFASRIRKEHQDLPRVWLTNRFVKPVDGEINWTLRRVTQTLPEDRRANFVRSKLSERCKLAVTVWRANEDYEQLGRLNGYRLAQSMLHHAIDGDPGEKAIFGVPILTEAGRAQDGYAYAALDQLLQANGQSLPAFEALPSGVTKLMVVNRQLITREVTLTPDAEPAHINYSIRSAEGPVTTLLRHGAFVVNECLNGIGEKE